MTLYKIIIDNRNYETWTIVSPSTLEPIILDKFNPKQHKLFNNDVFTYNGETVEILSIRELERINTQTHIISVDGNRNFYANGILVHNK